jgi:hypothetical protein
MSNFNLEDYETVKSRKERFYKDYPDGRIEVKLLNIDSVIDHAVFQAKCYMTAEDQKNNCPRGTGYALEVRDRELSVSQSGKQYESINYSSWTENCEESSVGRCLDNAGYSGNKKPSKEEMIKVGRMNVVMKNYDNELGSCPKCGKPLIRGLAGGKNVIKCSTNNWDRVAKKAVGCPYIKWITEPGDDVPETPYYDKEEQQEEPDF